MKTLSFSFILILTLLFTCQTHSLHASADASHHCVEHSALSNTAWRGVLDLGQVKLTLEFKIQQSNSDGSLTSTLACFEQNLHDFPVSKTQIKGDQIIFEVEALGLSFEAPYQPGQTEWIGTFKQNGAKLPLTLSKVAEKSTSPVALQRPQEPKAPFPYLEEEIVCSIPQSDITLSGTLTRPEQAHLSPAVILIPGSGEVDRNETLFGHQPFLVLADFLTRQGFAVLRFDKRGVGASSGDLLSATTEDLAQDVSFLIDQLKNHPYIDPNQIGLLGHSEGAIIAPLISSLREDVTFMVLLAPSVVQGKEILYEQGRLISKAEGLSANQIKKNSALQKTLISTVLAESNSELALSKLNRVIEEQVNSLPSKQQEEARANLSQQVQNLNSAWFRYFLTYDPAQTLKKAKAPLLALFGELDLQVPFDQNYPQMNKILKQSKHPDFQVVKLENTNHVFQKAKTGAISEYAQIEETIQPEVLTIISDWIKEKTDSSL